jgi:hypothetical protein
MSRLEDWIKELREVLTGEQLSELQALSHEGTKSTKVFSKSFSAFCAFLRH